MFGKWKRNVQDKDHFEIQLILLNKEMNISFKLSNKNYISNTHVKIYKFCTRENSYVRWTFYTLCFIVSIRDLIYI